MCFNPRPAKCLARTAVEMNHEALLLLLFLAAICCGVNRMQARSIPGAELRWSAKLETYGWSPPKIESNRSFFKNFSLAKLEAVDINTRILFVDDDLLVAYHTRETKGSGAATQRQVEVFFVNAPDGSLKYRKQWPTKTRKSMNNLRDSEGRLFGLQDGRFLVLANGAMNIYANDLSLIKQQQFEPLHSTDVWAVRAVAGGKQIFVRHESGSQVTYQWLASDSLRVLRTMPGYQARDFDSRALVFPGEDAVFTGSRSGVRMIRTDRTVKTICDEKLCRVDGSLDVLTSKLVGVSGRLGIGIVDEGDGLVWSKTLQQGQNPNSFQFGEMRSASSGTRFAVWMTALHKTLFDGIEIHSSPTVFVYDVTSRRLLLSIPIKSKGGDFDFALSPNGRQIAIYDGARISLYAID